MEWEGFGVEMWNDVGMFLGGLGGEFLFYDVYKLGIECKIVEFCVVCQSIVIKIVYYDFNEYVDYDIVVDVIDVLCKVGLDVCIDVILYMLGGISFVIQQILYVFLNYKGLKMVFVFYCVKFVGMMIVLVCDEIVMGLSVVLGLIDL